MANDDVINLGGQAFPVKGFTRGNSVSEFETGIKIGRATYDQREHAFFLVLDDFSAGFGHRRLDIRDELGTFWDSSKTNAPDLRRPSHFTLVPRHRVTAIDTLPDNVGPPARWKSDQNWIYTGEFIYFSIGRCLYQMSYAISESAPFTI